ncbi:MAG: hypothetical protein ACI3YT_01940 [Prevotella sp.]
MRKTLILSALAAMLPLTMNAQDDMYFVPTKKNVEKTKSNYGMPKDTYYSGSNRSIDEYNRRNRTECWEEELKDGSHVVAIDSLGNEIANVNVKKKNSRRDSTYVDEDYTYTRRMARWDGYDYSMAYLQGYSDGRFNRWYGWSTYYDPWYFDAWPGWYDRWYDSWYFGYSGWYGWYGRWRPYDYAWGWGWHDVHYPIYGGGGGGGSRWANSVDRFRDTRFSRTNSVSLSGSSISRGIANRDRSNSLGTRSINRSSASRRFGNSQGDNRSFSTPSRNTSYNNTSYNSSSSRSSSFSSGGGSSFSSGGSRSFGGGGGIKSSGAGRRR